MRGAVEKLAPEAGYGFLKCSDEWFFFHRNALTDVEFEELAPGSEVVFEVAEEAPGDRPDEHRRAANISLAEGQLPATDFEQKIA